MAKDAGGHGSEKRGGGSFQDVALGHQMKIARSTVKMPRAMANIMGGMTPEQAHSLIQQHGSAADKQMAATYAAIPDHSDSSAASELSRGVPAEKAGPAPTHPAQAPYEPRYNRAAVNNAIASSGRHGRPIGGKEASMIHRLLKGRQVGDE
jgi:hypothetical protein